MTEYSLRRLRSGDLPAYRELMALFADVFDDQATYRQSPPSDDYATSILEDATIFLDIAEQEGRIIGGLAGYELRKFEQARSEFYLYDLAVDARHRRRGVATALIDTFRAQARAHDAWVVFVQADLEDDPAIALYTGLGKREDVLHFDIAPAPKRNPD